jgi:hypothetical protein
MNLPTSIREKVNRPSTGLGGLLPFFLSILIPTGYRLVLEIVSSPYPIGFDPLGTYAPILTHYVPMDISDLYSLGPLYYLVLQSLYAALNDILLAVKIGSLCSIAALSMTLYLYTKGILGTPWRGFLATVLVSFYFPVLRVFWDLERNTLGLALLLLTLWLSTRHRKAAFTAGVVSALSHPTIPPLLFAALLPRIVSVKDRALLLISVAGIIVWLTAATVGNWFQFNYLGLSLLVYLVIPIFPWLVASTATSLKHKTNSETLALSAGSALFSGLPVILPVIQESARYALLAPFFIILHAVVACTSANWRRQRRAAMMISLAVVVGIFGAGYSLQPTENAFPYFAPPFLWNQSFLNFIPTSMQQNTLPLDQAKHTGQILTEAREAYPPPSYILVANDVIIGYAIMAGYARDQIAYSGGATDDPTSQARGVADQGLKPYVVWFKPGSEWYGVHLKQPEFRLLTTNGNMALYGFVYTNVGGGLWRIENGTVLGDSTGFGRTLMLTPAQVSELDLNLPVRIESAQQNRWGKAGFVLWKNSTTYYYFGITADMTGKLYASTDLQNGTYHVGLGGLPPFYFNYNEWYTLGLSADQNGTFQFMVNGTLIGRSFNTQIGPPWRLGLISSEGMRAHFDDESIVNLLWKPTPLEDILSPRTHFDEFASVPSRPTVPNLERGKVQNHDISSSHVTKESIPFSNSSTIVRTELS